MSDISGLWQIKITATGGTQVSPRSEWNAFIKAKQHGTTVSGTFVTEHGLRGQLAGSVSGDEVTMTIKQGPLRPGIFHGIGKVNATNNCMSGTYSGGENEGTLEASFTASKMNYLAFVLNKFKTRMYYFDEGKGIPLWTAILIGLIGISCIVAVFVVLYFYITFVDKFIPPGFTALGIVSIYGIYSLFKYLKKRN